MPLAVPQPDNVGVGNHGDDLGRQLFDRRRLRILAARITSGSGWSGAALVSMWPGRSPACVISSSAGRGEPGIRSIPSGPVSKASAAGGSAQRANCTRNGTTDASSWPPACQGPRALRAWRNAALSRIDFRKPSVRSRPSDRANVNALSAAWRVRRAPLNTSGAGARGDRLIGVAITRPNIANAALGFLDGIAKGRSAMRVQMPVRPRQLIQASRRVDRIACLHLAAGSLPHDEAEPGTPDSGHFRAPSPGSARLAAAGKTRASRRRGENPRHMLHRHPRRCPDDQPMCRRQLRRRHVVMRPRQHLLETGSVMPMPPPACGCTG